jgi:hypothetical protein
VSAAKAAAVSRRLFEAIEGEIDPVHDWLDAVAKSEKGSGIEMCHILTASTYLRCS